MMREMTKPTIHLHFSFSYFWKGWKLAKQRRYFMFIFLLIMITNITLPGGVMADTSEPRVQHSRQDFISSSTKVGRSTTSSTSGYFHISPPLSSRSSSHHPYHQYQHDHHRLYKEHHSLKRLPHYSSLRGGQQQEQVENHPHHHHHRDGVFTGPLKQKIFKRIASTTTATTGAVVMGVSFLIIWFFLSWNNALRMHIFKNADRGNRRLLQAIFLCVLQGSIASEVLCYLSKKYQEKMLHQQLQVTIEKTRNIRDSTTGNHTSSYHEKNYFNNPFYLYYILKLDNCIAKLVKKKSDNDSKEYKDGAEILLFQGGKTDATRETTKLHYHLDHRQAPIFVICCINIVIYCLWKFAESQAGQKMYVPMHRHFILPFHPKLLLERPHTYLCSTFSHFEFDHLFSNLLALDVTGLIVCKRIGIRAFSWFYVISAYGSHIIGTLLFSPWSRSSSSSLIGNKLKHLLRIPIGDITLEERYIGPYWNFIFQLGLYPGSLGASGAIFSLKAFSCLEYLFSGSLFSSAGFRSMQTPIFLVFLISIFSELFHLYRSGLDDSVGIINGTYAIHFGGYIFGVILYVAYSTTKQIMFRNVAKEEKRRT